MVVMFAAFVDFLIPENNFLRYVKVLLGLLVMIAIINPLIPLFHNDLSVDEISLVYEDFVDKKGIMSKSDILKKNNNELTMEEYKVNIEEYLAKKIADVTLHNIKNVTVKIDEDLSSREFGKITQVKITLSKNPPNGSNSKQEKISIEKIKISDEKLESSVFIQNPNEEFKDIINYLTETFDILEENIYIYLEE